MAKKLVNSFFIGCPIIVVSRSLHKKKIKTLSMPYVNIKITREGVTPEQKAQLIEGVTTLLQKVLNKNTVSTIVIIDEVETDNWGIAGEQVTIRKREK